MEMIMKRNIYFYKTSLEMHGSKSKRFARSATQLGPRDIGDILFLVYFCMSSGL